MKHEDRRKIIEWLRSPRPWAEGVALYQEHGCNLRLKREFAFGETPLLREILADQLMALADITPRELTRSAKTVTTAVTSSYKPAPEPVKAAVKIREKFPFLNSPDCPDVLKVMVADMLTSYDAYKKAHAALQDMPDTATDETFSSCAATVENYLLNRKIWDVLEYYKEHHELPEGVEEKEATPEEEISKLSDLDLASKYRSAVTNEGKHRKRLEKILAAGDRDEKAESMVQYWGNRKKMLKEEIEKRKKK